MLNYKKKQDPIHYHCFTTLYIPLECHKWSAAPISAWLRHLAAFVVNAELANGSTVRGLSFASQFTPSTRLDRPSFTSSTWESNPAYPLHFILNV